MDEGKDVDVVYWNCVGSNKPTRGWVNGEQLVPAGGSWEPLGQLGSIGYKLGANETMVGQTVSEWNLLLAYRACWDHKQRASGTKLGATSSML